MLRLFLGLAASALPSLAHAHVGAGDTHGALHGFMHPLGGLDHVLVMVAVGVLAFRIGGRAPWLVPLSFLGMMAAGGALGMAGVGLPFVEVGIGVSVVVLGLALALGLAPPVAAAAALVGLFAVFHGHAHGAEMPAGASGSGYALGFVLATALLHAVGLGLGLGLLVADIGALRARRVTQIAGGAMTLVGAALLAGAF